MRLFTVGLTPKLLNGRTNVNANPFAVRSALPSHAQENASASFSLV